jgi:pimeloyl-ACP methyl ester carboxylesterase/ketosteroid isomerase-like protein
VPGAQIYYEIQGAGPVLLMIPGGPTDAGIFSGIAPLLADRFTAVRYDPRGNSRSVVEGEPQDQEMDVHGDDAAALLAFFGDEPAFVLGSSGGGQIGLNLVARYPGRVKTLVAHEPPCMRLLRETGEDDKFLNVVQETYRAAGVGAAMQKFAEGAGLGPGRGAERKTPPSPELAEAFARTKGNAEFFIKHGMKPIGSYVPDVSALGKSATRVVVGVGEVSAGTMPYRTAVALAERLGVEPVVFPGGHGGYNDDAEGFAAKLHEVLSQSGISYATQGGFPMATATLDVPVSTDEAAILAVVETLSRAHREKDAVLFAAQFAEDAAIFNLAPPLIHHGVDLEEKKAWFESWSTAVTILARDMQVKVSGDMAICHGYLQMSGTKKGPEGSVRFWMRETLCLERRRDGWKIVHEHTSVPFYMDATLRPAFDLQPEEA